MEPAVMLFYEEGNKACEELMDLLESKGARVIPTDVYDEEYLSLVESWNVCCVPTIVFWPSYECYAAEQITEEVIDMELNRKYN